jgi:hypothetical protein
MFLPGHTAGRPLHWDGYFQDSHIPAKASHQDAGLSIECVLIAVHKGPQRRFFE